MILEEQRFLHEDLERLEQGISDRVADEPRLMRDRLIRDHQVAGFLNRIEAQSQRLLNIYKDVDGLRGREIQSISTGDPLEEFYKQLADIKVFHQKYPNEPVENLERAYKKRLPVDGELGTSETDHMFAGEEGFGRFFDLTAHHESYVNLPNMKRPTYLQYLDVFDVFTPPTCPIKRTEKMTEQYFSYVSQLVTYLQTFMRRTRPLQDTSKLFGEWDVEFEKMWDADDVPGWKVEVAAVGPNTASEGIWCPDCEKYFKNENVYKGHLTGKKHVRAAEARAAREAESGTEPANGAAKHAAASGGATWLKEKAIAEREFRVRRLAAAMSQERSDTRVNVERRQGMTDRERQMELDAMFAEDDAAAAAAAARASGGGGGGGYGGDSDSESDGDEKIYNPLKLPLAWDGKPIPFWLYKLHGLGVEFPCEICGNFVYMGRRAFDKHFNEARHIYGLKCLGIGNTTLFREITGIGDALKLWDKMQREKKREMKDEGGIVQMEDADGNVMPEKVYYDLQKQGLL